MHSEIVLPSPPAKKWLIGERHPEAEAGLIDELGISPLVAAVLAQRGFTDPESADKFLNPKLDHLHRPQLLPDFEEAAKAILGARERKELIYIHGDYDVDGISSTALFTRFLKKIGCRVQAHVPHRMKEGYGIHIDAVKWAKEAGTDLFVTCDCGVSAHEQMEAVREAGMSAVVTDHHALKDTLPHAAAVVNPHRSDSKYPFPELSGAGVVLKLCAGLTEELNFPVDKFYRAFLDLAVLGTVADVMPLVDENRIIAKFGLVRLADTQKPGLKSLINVSKLRGQELRASHIGFQIGPRINAVGRIGDAGEALNLFMTDDQDQADKTAARLDELNEQRKADQQDILDEAMAMVLDRDDAESPALVVAQKGWHAGIIGIVASKLVEQFYRPAFVVAVQEDGKGKGSARSIKGFHLAEALRDASDHLLTGGGHEMAAGFSLDEAMIDRFRKSVQESAKASLTPEDYIPKLEVDAEVSFDEAGPEAAQDLERMEPFGEANPRPRFLCRDVRLAQVQPMQRHPQHAKLQVEQGSDRKSAIAFRLGEKAMELAGEKATFVFRPEFNTYQGRSEFRWNVEDFRHSGEEDPTIT